MQRMPHDKRRPQAKATASRRKNADQLPKVRRAPVAQRDGAGAAVSARFTSFATYIDLVRYIKCLLAGGSENGCYAKGDNGVGAGGKRTATTASAMCALPKSAIVARWGSLKNGWGKPVICHVMGKTATCTVEDIAPLGVCDLNPGALEALGMDDETELDAPGMWQWGI